MRTHLGFGLLAVWLTGCDAPAPFSVLFPESGNDCLTYVEDVDVVFPEVRFPDPSKPTSLEQPVATGAASASRRDPRFTSVESHVSGCSEAWTDWDSIAVDVQVPEGAEVAVFSRAQPSWPWTYVGNLQQSTSLTLPNESSDGLYLRVELVAAPDGEAPALLGATVMRECEEQWEDGCG